MPRYRFLYKTPAGSFFKDVESNSLAHALWETAKQVAIEESSQAELVDTMTLPSRDNSHQVPSHVNLYPNWEHDHD